MPHWHCDPQTGGNPMYGITIKNPLAATLGSLAATITIVYFTGRFDITYTLAIILLWLSAIIFPSMRYTPSDLKLNINYVDDNEYTIYIIRQKQASDLYLFGLQENDTYTITQVNKNRKISHKGYKAIAKQDGWEDR